MLSKKDIDERVARSLGLKLEEVSLITTTFLRAALHGIVDDDEGVKLEGFGRFILRAQQAAGLVAYLRKGTGRKGQNRGIMPVKSQYKYRVWFKKAGAFREALWDHYGKPSEEVDDDDE